jgi:hypothetical protein
MVNNVLKPVDVNGLLGKCMKMLEETKPGNGAIISGDCVATVEAALLSAEAMKNLGSNVVEAGRKLKDAVGSGDFTDFEKLTAGDMSSLIGEIAEQAEKGTKMTKAGAKKMLNKLKGEGGWGAIKDWGVDKIAEAGSLLDGLDATDIAAVKNATFDAAMGYFGKVVSWDKDQAKGLADKLKNGLNGDMTKCTAEILAKGKGFLSGLTYADLATCRSAADGPLDSVKLLEVATKVDADRIELPKVCWGGT